MKRWQKHRIVAVLLLLATLLGMIPFSAVYADGEDGSMEAASADTYGGRSLQEILELISGMTYGNYTNKWSDKTVASDKSEVLVNAADALVQPLDPSNPEDPTRVNSKTGEAWTNAPVEVGSVVDKSTGITYTGVYTPATGQVTFKITIPEEGMYAIDLNYIALEQYDFAGDTNADGSPKGPVTVGTKTTIERMFFIDGELPFNECRYLYIPRSWEYKKSDLSDYLYRDIVNEEWTDPVRSDYATQEAYDAKMKEFYLKGAAAGTREPRRQYYASDAEYVAALDAWAMLTNGGSGNFYWDKDIQDNDMRPERTEVQRLRTYFLRDWLGYTVEPFQYYLTKGDHYFTFEATREPLFISSIRVYGYKAEDAYDYQYARWISSGLKPYEGDKFYMVEAESPVFVSDQVLFPGTDRTSSINSPSHPANLVYNIANSSFVGQYMTYNVYVEEEGLYNIVARFRQNTMAGMFTSRRIRINGDVQFKEANYLRFNYDTSFQNVLFGDEDNGAYYFHLKKGWNTVEMEVVLGDMSNYIYDIADVISKMTDSYQKILQITGTNPDTGRDYGFMSLIPDVMTDLANCALELERIYESLVEITGATGQHIATLDTIRSLVAKMAADEYEIAPNFLSFKNYLTALSNWLYTSLSQPMKLDYLRIQSSKAEVPRAKATFFYAIGHEAKAFVASFVKDYNVIGFKTDANVKYAGEILMWNTVSREDALILRTMIDGHFTPKSNIAVNIRYVAQGLQESVLAGVGPDIANMASGTAVSWGLRNSVEDFSRIYTEEDIKNKKNLREGAAVGQYMFDGFRELAPIYSETKNVTYTNSVGKDVTEEQVAGEFVIPHYFYNEATDKAEFKDVTGTIPVKFSHAALEAVSLNNKTYLIPTTMNYEMSFYRVDVFAKYGLEPPRTWQELLDIIPKLTTQHMTMGMQTSLAGYQMLLYQMGDTMYASDYCEFNKSGVALEAFETLCDLFNDYSLPIAYDLTRFRTGEIPIVVANWTTYNSFMSYYELRGLWTMESLIGWEHYDANTGDTFVNRASILNVEGIVIPRGSDNPQNVWQYIKWYSDDDAQEKLCRLNLADQNNTTVKYNTANLNALLSQAWTDDERDAMREQIPHLKGLPFNPGDYNISRYINFAFLAVYNSNANAVDQFLDYVVDINKELSRKREEYHLPYLKDGELVVPEAK